MKIITGILLLAASFSSFAYSFDPPEVPPLPQECSTECYTDMFDVQHCSTTCI
jgi:hypothetical protein